MVVVEVDNLVLSQESQIQGYRLGLTVDGLSLMPNDSLVPRDSVVLTPVYDATSSDLAHDSAVVWIIYSLQSWLEEEMPAEEFKSTEVIPPCRTQMLKTVSE